MAPYYERFSKGQQVPGWLIKEKENLCRFIFVCDCEYYSGVLTKDNNCYVVIDSGDDNCFFELDIPSNDFEEDLNISISYSRIINRREYEGLNLYCHVIPKTWCANQSGQTRLS